MNVFLKYKMKLMEYVNTFKILQICNSVIQLILSIKQNSKATLTLANN